VVASESRWTAALLDVVGASAFGIHATSLRPVARIVALSLNASLIETTLIIRSTSH